MTNWIDLTNFCVACAGLLIVLLGLFLSLSASYMERATRRFFVLFFSLLIAYVLAEVTEQISLVLLGPRFAALSLAAVYLESLLSSLLMPMLTVFLLRSAGRSERGNALFRAACALWLVYFTLLTATQFTGSFYYITAENVYRRGPWYPVLLVPPVLLMLLDLYAFFRVRGALTPRQRLAFLVYLLLPLGCMLVQMAAYGLLMIVIGTSLAALFLFMFLLYDQMDRYVAQRQESARQRASILVLQMRPHFIYNTMISIYHLCTQDAKRAQQVTLDFTDYLQRNFTAIAKEDTIPFADELEHTRAYLRVEQVRFEDKLFVLFDTPCTMFRVPPLTLQPIVENSVKHGVSPDLEPLYITVLTRETDAGSEIIVEDNGPGFSPADDDAPHIALANIRERLAMMCGGTLTIETRKGGGTRVTVFVPTRKAEWKIRTPRRSARCSDHTSLE